MLKHGHVQGGITSPVFSEEHCGNDWKMSSKQLQKLEQKPQGEKREEIIPEKTFQNVVVCKAKMQEQIAVKICH